MQRSRIAQCLNVPSVRLASSSSRPCWTAIVIIQHHTLLRPLTCAPVKCRHGNRVFRSLPTSSTHWLT